MILLRVAIIGIITLGSCVAVAQEPLSQIPHAEFDRELVGSAQREVEENFRKEFSFFPPDVRLFLVSRPLKILSPLPPYDPRRANATLFAVFLRDKRVVKLDAVSDFTKLDLQIRTEKDALQLVQLFSDFPTGGIEIIRFKGMQFMEIPENKDCICVTQVPLQTAGIKKTSIRTLYGANKEKSFEITRYVLPNYVNLGFGEMYTFDSMNKIIEHVTLNASYTMISESIPTLGLSVGNQCRAR